MSTYKNFLRSHLLLGASIAFTLPSTAEDMPQNSDENAIEEIVIIGERAINQATIDRKSSVTAIYDSVNLDDIGRLPDLNVPDAFRRVPGVTAIFDEDEGRFVTARGLPPAFNFVTFDGAAIATVGGFGDGSRNVNLETIPSTAVKRLEVYKTFSSDIDLGASGGYFNLVTRSAFDVSDTFFLADGNIVYYSFDDVPQSNAFNGGKDSFLAGRLGGRAEFTLSDRFGSNDEFGFVLSASYLRKTRDEEKVIPDNYRFVGDDDDGDGLGDIAVPERFRWYVYTNTAQRYGGNAKIEWQPSPNTYLSINNFIYISEEDETRTGHQIRGIAADDITPTSATTGTITDAFGELTFNYFPLDYQYTGNILSAEHTFKNGGQLTATVGYTTAKIDDTIAEIFLRTAANQTELGGTYDLSGRFPSFSVNDPSYWSDTNNYTVLFNRLRERFTDEHIWDAKVNYDYNTARGDRGLGFKVGSAFRSQIRERDIDMTYFAQGYTIDGDILADEQTDYTPPGRDGVPFVFIDYNKIAELADLTVDTVQTTENSLNNDFRYREEILSGYLLGTYGGTNWRVTAGLRYEDVNVNARNFIRTPQAGIDLYEESNRQGGYDKLAPSFLATYEPRENVRLKAGFSQTLGRPNPDQIASTAVLSADGLSITRGNPDLQPREVNNFDLGLEYYFDQGESLFSIAFFYKDITNEIVSRTEDVQIDGETVSITQPVNAETSEVFGVELALIKDRFDFLPAPFNNFGFSGNLTYTDAQTVLNSDADPVQSLDFLAFQPEVFGNATLFYAWGDTAEVRLAYNYQGRYYDNTTTSLASQTGVGAFGQLDFTARYNLTSNWIVRFDARNITNENRNDLRGPNLSLLKENVEFGQTFLFGVSYKL